MATGGNIQIYGDPGISDNESQSVLDEVTGTDAVKLMALFQLELKHDETKNSFKLQQMENPPAIKIIGKLSEKRFAKAVKEKWVDLIERLHYDVITGHTETTFVNVNKIIQRNKFEDKVVPCKCNKEKMVRLFSRNEKFITLVKAEYGNPDPWAENPSTTPFSKELSNSKRRQKDNVASFSSFDSDIVLQFVTDEGLVVKVYKKPITRLDVDAIVNAANDMLGNYGGIADVISKAAGYDMEGECKGLIRKYGKLKDAENQVTGAGNLRYKGVIHAVGPRWSNYHNKYECLNVLLATVINILESARRNKFSTVAMPPISSGIFAVPKRMCAAMYLKGIFEFSKQGYLESLKEFHIIDIHDEMLDMIKEWYTKYKIDPACIEVSAVLKSSDSDHRSPLNRPPAWQHDERANKRKSDNFSESQRRKGQVGQGVMQARATDPRPSKTKVVPKFCGKTDILIYTGNILQLQGIDVVVVSEDGLIKGEGGLSMALLNAGCDRYKKEHKQLKPMFQFRMLEYNQKTVLLTSGGDKLPFRYVLHAILRRQIGEQEQIFQRRLQSTIDNVLLKANVLNMKSKKGITIVLPMIGLGSKPTEDVIMKCCWSVRETIEKYLKTIQKVRIEEIHLVNQADNVTEILQKYFDPQKHHTKPQPRPLQRPHSRAGDRDKYTPLKSLKQHDIWKMDAKANKRQDVSQYMSTNIKKQKQKGNLNILNDEAQADDDLTCVVCLCEMDDPVELKECKHVFCRECIMEVFGAKPSCPVCGAVYGNIYGDQPRDGCATVYIDDEALPGYPGKKTLIISYDFPDGKQETFHPEPGKPYDGLKRRGILPYNKEGTEVLNLLKRAFQQGLTFTIGTSRTSGKEGVITWNDIHHKTSKTGGPQKFGYPDPEYLTRVKDELASKGVSSDG